MNFRLFYFLVAITLAPNLAFGQSPQSEKYFLGGPDHQFVKLLYSPRNVALKLNRNDNPFFQGEPLNRDLIGVGVFFLGLGLEAYVPSPRRSALEEKWQTDRKAIDFQGNIFARKFSVQYAYQQYQGWENIPANSFNHDFYFRQLSVTGLYFLKPDKFSWKSPVNQTTRHIKSGGSPIAGLEIRGLKLDSGPEGVQFIPFETNWSGAMLWPGYGHYFRWKAYYLSLGMLAGFGMLNHSMDDRDLNDRGLHQAWGYRFRSGLGYNNGKLLIGALYQTETVKFNGMSYEAWLDNSLIKFSIGYRWPAPKAMEDLRMKLPILRSFN